MKIIAMGVCVLLAGCAGAQHVHTAQPYAGQQDRQIKALSADDVSGYLAGAGMGYAKAAELNGYPGPMHSLENAQALSLSTAQRQAIDGIMRDHKSEARRLGEEVVRLERELDRMFADRSASPPAVEAKLHQIADAQAQLRASHLKAHLATAALLTPQQIDRYRNARGY